jgi:hypothetical protein
MIWRSYFIVSLKKIDERLDCIERKYRRNYKKRDRKKEREDRIMKREKQIKSRMDSFEILWKDLVKNLEKDKVK